MIFVLNKCYGGWGLSEFACEKLGIEDDYSGGYTVEDVAALIKEHGSEKISGRSAQLEIVEIPDTMTDYKIDEYDGFEVITYVVDGKLHEA